MFDPIELPRGLKLKNRLVLAPMTTYASQASGWISDDEIPYLERRAKAGYGMTMAAACYVHKSGHAFKGQWRCDSDEFLESLASVARAIKGAGSAAVLQIHHGGRMCFEAISGMQPWSASAVPSTRPNAEVPHEMTEGEIRLVIDKFAEAAERAKRAGFNGVEIHGANTYLLQQFVSPHSNRRSDIWGLDRLRFPLAVTDAVLSAVGSDFPIGYRFSPEEVEEPGLRIEDTENLVDQLCRRPLSWLHISLGNYKQSSLVGQYEEPALTRIARLIGGRVPFIGVGRIWSVEAGEEALSLGADMVAFGKVAITEPELPGVFAEGGVPRLTVPARDAERLLTLPKGFAEKIYSTPGWFDVESESELE